MTNRLEWGVEFVVRLGVGSTLLLLVGLLAMAVCRRQSAAMRYWIGTWTAVALLLLPLAAVALPSWQLGLLDRGKLNLQLENRCQETVQHDVMEPTIVPRQGLTNDRLTSQQGVRRLDRPTAAIASNTPLPLSTNGSGVRNPQSSGEPQTHELSASQFTATSLVIKFLLIIYTLGLGVGLWQLSFAHYTIGRWIRTAQADLPPWILQIAEDCRGSMGLSHEVPVRLSRRVAVPVVAGMIRPMILLPESVVHWPIERVRAALAHELAHIERGDLWTLLLSQLVHCIYWPQPLVYWWSRGLRIEREAACDDRVLTSYSRPTQYARHLLDVAAELTGQEQAQPAALAMARGTQIERRIAAILSSTCRRAPPARAMVAGMCASAVIGTLMAASVSPFTALKGQEIDNAKAPARTASDERNLYTFSGRVVFADGRPAAGARVRNSPSGEDYPGITTVADANGNYELVLPASGYHAPFIAELAEARGFTQVELAYSMQDRVVEMEVADIVLKEGKRIEVEVVDKMQTPVAEAAIYVQANNGLVERLESDANGKATLVYPVGLRLQTIGAVKARVGCDYHAFEKLSDFAQGPVRRPKPPQDFEGMIRLTLDGIREVSVKVIGPDGAPLAGVLMESSYSFIKDRDNLWSVYGLPEFARETDAQGVAYFDMLSSHENGGVGIVPRLNRKDWYVSGEHGGANIDWEKSDSATLQLAEKLLVGGSVHHADGSPAAGIAIRAAGDFKYCFGFNERVHSDEQGRWQMWVKPNGYYLFAVQGEQFASQPHSGIIVLDNDPPQNLDFQLEPAHRVHGKIAGPIDEAAHVMLQQRAKDYYDLPQDQWLPNPENNSRPISVFIQDVVRVSKDGTFEFNVGPGDFTIWNPSNETQEFTITDQLEVDLGDLRVPPPRRLGFVSPAELARQAFKSKESLQHRFTLLSRQARESNQQLLIIAGSATSKSTIELFEVLKNRDAQRVLASYRQLPIDVSGKGNALNRKFLQTLAGHEIDVNATELFVLDDDLQVVAATSVAQLQSGANSLHQALVEFAQRHQTAVPRTTTISVTDETGKSLAGADVFRNHVFEFEKDKAHIENQHYTSDASGKVLVTLSGTSVDLRLWVTLDGYVPLYAMWAKKFQSDGDQIPDQFTFSMQPGTEIGGMVVDETGAPIVGAIVEVKEPAVGGLGFGVGRDQPGIRPVRNHYLAEDETALITDTNGRWLLCNVPSESQLDAPELLPLRHGPKLAIRVTLPGQEQDEDGYGRLQREQDISHASLRDKSARFVVPEKTQNPK